MNLITFQHRFQVGEFVTTTGLNGRIYSVEAINFIVRNGEVRTTYRVTNTRYGGWLWRNEEDLNAYVPPTIINDFDQSG